MARLACTIGATVYSWLLGLGLVFKSNEPIRVNILAPGQNLEFPGLNLCSLNDSHLFKQR